MNDAPFQQTHEESAPDRQIVAVLHIGIDENRLNDTKMLTVIISADNAPRLEDVHILRVGGDIHLKAAAFVVFDIPQQT